MRVRANTIPSPFEITQPNAGKVRVLLRENVRYLSENEVEYDEYTIVLQNSTELEKSLRENTRAWIAYARRMESRPNSSALWHLEEQHNEELAAMIDAVYQSDLQIFGLEVEENV